MSFPRRQAPSRSGETAAWWATWATLGTLFGALGVAGGSAAGAPDENELRAVFVYRFTQMVDWPASAFGAADDPLTVCGLGDDPTEGQLEKAVAGQRSHDRVVDVRWIDDGVDIQLCQVLYVREEDPAAIDRVLERLGTSPVLTIGDAEGFAEQGGMIELRKLDRRMQFEINRGAAERAGLRIQTKLLGHAATVLP